MTEPKAREIYTHILHKSDELLWQKAIKDAEFGIKQSGNRMRRLRRAIKTFKERLRNGEPFPKTDESDICAKLP